jgi:hypothetical protein
MSTAKDQAKKIRRAVGQQANSVREQVAVDMILRIYMLPLGERIKWAAKIVRGLPMKESLVSWTRSVFRRLAIFASHWVKTTWTRLVPGKPEYVPDEVVPAVPAKDETYYGDSEVELNWLKKDKENGETNWPRA